MEFLSSEKRKRVCVDEKMSPVEKPCGKMVQKLFNKLPLFYSAFVFGLEQILWQSKA